MKIEFAIKIPIYRQPSINREQIQTQSLLSGSHIALKENPALDFAKCLVVPHGCQASSSQRQLAGHLRARGFPDGGERTAALLHADVTKHNLTPLGS